MARDSFPPGVADQLKWYVYRLIDPRNGETFYVGKGEGNRIFQHAKSGLSKADEEVADKLKCQTIKDIRAAGLDVTLVIHWHSIEDEQVAFQIEAAVIDSYPGLDNEVRGHGTGEYGCKNVEQIVTKYAARPFTAREPLILISIANSYKEKGRSIYDAVRYAWNIDVNRARNFKLVLAHRQGVVVGVFRPKRWLAATRANFPGMIQDDPDRWGFVGKDAGERAASIYLRKLVPREYRARAPVRYLTP